MTILSLCSILVLVVVIAGCEPASERCDRNQHYAYGLCYELDAGPSDPSYAHFGDVCMTVAACTAPTEFCNRPPAAPVGYCTRTGCVADPAVCPDGWHCLDLSVTNAGLAAVCVQP